MEGPTSSLGSRNRLTCLTVLEHDDDDGSDVFIEIDGISLTRWQLKKKMPKFNRYIN